MNETEFTSEYKKIINHIAESIENLDLDGDMEVDINTEILTLENKAGTYVINKQGSLREIWLSSPVSGPYHFAFNSGKWLSNDAVEFFSLLSTELGIEIKY